jgi:hypothetical protein
MGWIPTNFGVLVALVFGIKPIDCGITSNSTHDSSSTLTSFSSKIIHVPRRICGFDSCPNLLNYYCVVRDFNFSSMDSNARFTFLGASVAQSAKKNVSLLWNIEKNNTKINKSIVWRIYQFEQCYFGYEHNILFIIYDSMLEIITL